MGINLKLTDEISFLIIHRQEHLCQEKYIVSGRGSGRDQKNLGLRELVMIFSDV